MAPNSEAVFRDVTLFSYSLHYVFTRIHKVHLGEAYAKIFELEQERVAQPAFHVKYLVETARV